MCSRKQLNGLGLSLVLLLLVVLVENAFQQIPPIPPNELKKIAHDMTGYSAKSVCSFVFVSKRKPAAQNPLFQELDGEFAQLANITIDYQGKQVFSSASKAGLPTLVRVAKYDELLGCRLMDGYKGLNKERFTSHFAGMNWNVAINAKVQQVVDSMFKQNALGCNLRSTVVIKNRKIIAEGYVPQFTQDTAQIGNSMTKSIINALIGMRVKEGRMSLNDKVQAPEWQFSPNDPRNSITVNQMLRMSSGLEWNEDYGTLSDVSLMLYNYVDSANYAANKSLAYPPASHFYYSSGTSNILSRKIRESFKGFGGDTAYWNYPRQFLESIGVDTSNAKLEVDPTFTFVGSSFSWLTARDWAKFGQLYLDDGIVWWNGKRILPEGWVDYSRTETTTSTQQQTGYGAHFWLEKDYPKGTFVALGYLGQRVVVIPESDMVIVRLGLDKDWYNPPCSQKDFERSIIKAATESS